MAGVRFQFLVDRFDVCLQAPLGIELLGAVLALVGPQLLMDRLYVVNQLPPGGHGLVTTGALPHFEAPTVSVASARSS